MVVCHISLLVSPWNDKLVLQLILIEWNMFITLESKGSLEVGLIVYIPLLNLHVLYRLFLE